MFARGLAVLEIEFKQKGKQSNWHPTLYNFLWFQLLIGMTTDFLKQEKKPELQITHKFTSWNTWSLQPDKQKDIPLYLMLSK